MEPLPRSGVDFPGTWQAFEAWFPDDEACRVFLARVALAGRVPLPVVRWDRGVGDGAWPVDVSALWSPDLGHGGHDLPPKSLPAAGLVRRDVVRVRPEERGLRARCCSGCSASVRISTAWTWMHKLRRAMVRPDRDRLGGPDVSVEIDQTFIGGRTQGRGGLRYANKTEVVIAVERRAPHGTGTGPAGAHRYLADGAMSSTTSSPATSPPARSSTATAIPPTPTAAPSGYTCATNGSSCRAHRIPAHELLPAVHRVASLLKRWLAGTLHDGQSADHLDYYLDEFTFRFNRRTSRSAAACCGTDSSNKP